MIETVHADNFGVYGVQKVDAELRRHGAVMTLADPGSWPAPSTESARETARYGGAQARSWDRMHPRLTHRGAWAAHPGRLPIVEGTLIRLQVEHLPGARAAKPI